MCVCVCVCNHSHLRGACSMMLCLCCWSSISLALSPFPLCTPSRSILGPLPPSGPSCGADFRIAVSQNPPWPTAPPTRPPPSPVSTFQLLFWISQTAPVRSSLPSTLPPTEPSCRLPSLPPSPARAPRSPCTRH